MEAAMKRIIFIIAFGILIGMQAYSWDGGRARVSFGVFFDALQPYGEWVDVSDYGYCWRPTGIDRNWRPYMDGRWVWSDQGWLWVSYEDWGWAPYHYGRWTYDDYYGWIWVPDYDWGPSWVQWRYTDGYIGWAPLPPRAGFHFSIGIDIQNYGVPYFGWCFTAGFGFYSDHPRIYDVEQNHHYLRITRNVTNIRESGRGFINHGLDYRNVERMNRTRIRPARIEDERTFGTGRGSTVEGDRVRVYRPSVRPDTRNEIETRVRDRSVIDGSIRGQTQGEDARRDVQRQPDIQRDRNIERETPRPDTRGFDKGQMKNTERQGVREETQNRHPQPENQPRFNIPERKEDPRREMKPQRPATPPAPQIERRRVEPQSPPDRRGESGDRRGGSEQRDRSGNRRR
jgi:hypothetical protein